MFKMFAFKDKLGETEPICIHTQFLSFSLVIFQKADVKLQTPVLPKDSFYLTK